MSEKLYESYEWTVPFETSSVQGKKVIIRGKAIHATVSKNLRQYVKQELIEFGRTLAGKYIDVNHEYSVWREQKRRYDAGETAISPGKRPKLKGNVIDSQYNHLNGFVEYVAEVNHPEYAQKLIDRERMTIEAYVEKWGKTPITTVSVDANFRFKRDLAKGLEPHGIIGNGLSMVEDPKIAGVEGTSLEVMEIRETQRLDAQFTILQNLFTEKGIKTKVMEENGVQILKEEKHNMNSDEEKAIKRYNFTETEWKDLDAPTRMTYIKETLKEQDDCPEGQHLVDGECVPDVVEQDEECQEGYHRNEVGDCVPNEATEQDEECPEGQHRNEEGECVPNEVTEQDEPCPEGEHRNEAGECVPDEISEQEDCQEGYHRNEAGECVPDEVSEVNEGSPDTTVIGHDLEDIGTEEDLPPEHDCGEGMAWDDAAGACMPIKGEDAPLLLIQPIDVSPPEHPVPDTLGVEMLHLGEPFADYTSFEDCVAKNSDKEDPAAYCAGIQNKTEGETLAVKLEETKTLHRQRTQGRSIAHIAQRQEASDKRTEARLKAITDSLTEVIGFVNKQAKTVPCAASVKKLFEVARGTNKSTKALNKSILAVNRKIMTESKRLNTSMSNQKTMHKNMKTLNESITASHKKLQTQLKTQQDSFASGIAESLTELTSAIGALATIQETTHEVQETRYNESTTVMQSLLEQVIALKESLPAYAKVEDINKVIEQVNSSNQQQASTIEALNTKVDTVGDTQGNAIETLNTKVTASEDKLKELKSGYPTMTEIDKLFKEDASKRLTETTDKDAKDAERDARIDNLEEKMKKPAFQAEAPEVTEQSSVKAVEGIDPAIG